MFNQDMKLFLVVLLACALGSNAETRETFRGRLNSRGTQTSEWLILELDNGHGSCLAFISYNDHGLYEKTNDLPSSWDHDEDYDQTS